MHIHPDCKKVLISEEQIIARCEELGKQIDNDYNENKNNLLIVGILKGSILFMAELIKHIGLDIEIDFMATSSYEGTKSSGSIKIVKDLEAEVCDRDILLVEDILDTGLTISELKKVLYARGAKDVKVVALLNKEEGRQIDIKADYVGFEIENEFVIGYGLDYNQKYRNLPYIGVIKEGLY